MKVPNGWKKKFFLLLLLLLLLPLHCVFGNVLAYISLYVTNVSTPYMPPKQPKQFIFLFFPLPTGMMWKENKRVKCFGGRKKCVFKNNVCKFKAVDLFYVEYEVTRLIVLPNNQTSYFLSIVLPVTLIRIQC